ncbi:helix-turn-helix transcriptional regulator [Ideonella azotifigens]|uniref:Winged helix-turn-helix domain-containing protein n=1 Tax=Ideonella azotifigens TaxID=513160 RepID=A0ABN1JWN6_9BURK|nr:winged helix-turn-helix domain-containing protein [Ideonella azotifigens]MCD2343192.1 helix-turn-helix transcriptional regulator [Ideonella azotifigens]
MNHAAEQARRAFAFGPFTLLPERRLLLKGETPLRIGGRALDILTALVERPGEMVTKRGLMARAWPTTIVDESNLKVNMAGLRRLLGEEGGAPRYIATVIGRGYRFVADVQFSGLAESLVDHAQPMRKHNLPTGTTRVVGRAEVIAALQQDLEGSRLVSLVGPGGIGKTTVAIATADRALPSFKDGVWLVDLAPLKDSSLIPNAIATAIGMAAHSANVLAALCSFLRDREILLVLDSCEHIIDAAATCVDRLLTEASKVRILVTSREPLSLQGERVRRLPGLKTPPVTPAINRAQAVAFPAVELFVERAVDRLESFNLSNADAPAVAEICRRLDGHALAIELAATRVDVFGIGEILARLNDRFRLLKGRRSGPDRHQTLMATIDWSFDLLSNNDQKILSRLSVFAGAFTLASACAVAADDGIDRVKVVEGVANLVAKSLLAAEPGEIELAYRLLDTTRSYASEKLAAHDEPDSAHLRHALHFLELAGNAKADDVRLTGPDWLARHAEKIDDIRTAIGWAFAGSAHAALGVKLTVAAIPFWERLSLFEECRLFVKRALENSLGTDRTRQDELTLCLAAGGAQLFTRGPMQEVKDLFTKALALAEELNRADLRLECLKRLSEYHLWEGDSRSSLALSAEIRALASAEGDLISVANADAHAGSALHYLGDLSQSHRHLEDFLASPVQTRAGWETARFQFNQRLEARGSLAFVQWLLGFPEQALATAKRHRVEAEQSNHAVPICSAIAMTAAPLAIYTGDFAGAEQALNFAARHAAAHGLPMWGAMTECVRIKWLLDSGREVDLKRYEETLVQIRDGSVGIRYAPFIANLGHVLSLRGDTTGALANIDEALSLSASSGQVWGIPEMLRLKGTFIEAGRQAGWADAAAECYLQSINMAHAQGALAWELRSATNLAALWADSGSRGRGKDMLSSIYRQFNEGFETKDLRNARRILEAM